MAAIDKLWLKDYNDLSNLRSWALVYYPKLFVWLNIDYTKETFDDAKQNLTNHWYSTIKTQWKKASSDGTLNSAIAYYISQGYSTEEAEAEAAYLYEQHNTPVHDMFEDMELSVMNTPLYVDRKLKQLEQWLDKKSQK